MSQLLGAFNPATQFTSSTLASSTMKYRAAAIATLETVDMDGKALSPTDARYVYLECQFNPETLAITKQVQWKGEEKLVPALNAPDLDFGGGMPATFSLDLIFDTTREADDDSARDVRKYTNQLFRLVMLFGNISQRLPPPRIKFEWGGVTLFLAVVKKVSVTFTLFHHDGIPVRATAKVDFVQLDDSDDYKPRPNPTSRTEARKTRVVQMGERLDYIAFEEYGHVSHWRYLAEVNNLLDPRALRPGQILLVPPLP